MKNKLQFFLKCYIIDLRKKFLRIRENNTKGKIMRKIHVISNPVAGKAKADKNLHIVKKILMGKDIDHEVHFSRAKGDATQIAKALTSQGEKEIVALGGDGTLHEVLNGLVEPTACKLGLIPSGTGNDFAEHIGLPFDAQKATDVILNGQVKATDYLEVGGVRCMNVAGIGMDVDVLERCQKGKLKGKIKYYLSLIQSLFSYKGIKVMMEKNGEVIQRDVLIAAVCNGSQFGGGIRICPNAKENDGKLEAVVVDCIGGKFKLIKALLTLLKGRILQYPATTHSLCERIVFKTEKPCTLQMDGELYKGLIFDAKICKGLQFYRP